MATKREANVLEWTALFKQSLLDATSFKQFRSAVETISLRHPLDGDGILQAWAAAHDGSASIRARLVKYLEQLFYFQTVDHSEALKYVNRNLGTLLLLQDKYLIKSGPAKGEWKQSCEAIILERLTFIGLQLRTEATVPTTRIQIVRTFSPLLSLVANFSSTTSGTSLVGPGLFVAIEIAKYILFYINELEVTGILSSHEGGPPKSFKRGFGMIVPPFIAILANSLVNAPPDCAELAGNLNSFQQQAGLFENPDSDEAQGKITNNLNTMTFLQNVTDVPLVTTRAALYVYLNAMLTGRPLCNDEALFTYLNTRYSGNVEGLISDLITASFDVLANAINRTEPAESINVYRSFLINKMPVLLEQFSGMLFAPSSMESCITGALHRMDPSTDPFSNQTFDLLSSSGMISEARQEFLFACALFNLIPESSIETILGDVPMQSLPESGKYDKNTLVSQCTTNSNRVEELIRELEDFGGNSSVVAAAIVDIIQTLCNEKDSMTLKGVCNTLLKRTQALDILLLFTPALNILQPLCGFLDNWQDPEDQTEYHPVYEEFGSIFFLVLVFRQHFDFSLEEFKINYPDSFIQNYVINGCTPLDVNKMSQSQKDKLGAWVKGLYDSENLDNDVLSTCTPKEFHMLVATLFDQTLKASQSGVLGMDTIKGGFEYLLDPFVLPSIITALGWATRVLWSTRNPAPHLDHLLPLLSLLIRPPSLSSETTGLHDAVLSVAARPLERALAHVQKLHPRRQDIDPLLSKLKSRVQAPRAAITSHSELEAWSTTVGNPGQGGNGGFPAAIRGTLHSLITWSASGSQQSAPPNYTHRQLLMGLQMLGAPHVLSGLVSDAVKVIASGQLQEVVLDVVSALICAPSAAKGNTISLRGALTIACEDAYTLSKTDMAKAEFIVKLQRRVEAQCPAKQERPNQIVDDTMMLDAAQVVNGGQVQADAVDIEGIMKDVGGSLGDAGDFGLGGDDADASALFDI